MATTTPNFGWSVPTSSDLVKNGATAIETLGDSIDASLVDLKGGTTGQVLAKASNTDMDFSWVAQDDSNAIQNALLTTTGDTIYASGASTPARLGIGSTGQVLTVSGGIPAWATPAGGSTASGCTAFTSTAQNTTQNVYTVINLNSEAFDTDALHSTSTNTSRLTIPTGKGGYWLVNAFTVIDASGNDVFLQVFKNGSAITGYGQWDDRFAASNYGGAGYVVATGSQAYPLAAGDYIEIAVRSAKATGANCLNMTFSAMYLGA
jgi:hypothetical protein